MALGLSIFLNGFGVVAFMLGFTLILGEKRADKFNLLFFGICCSSMIWCLSYTVQLMVPLERVGYLTRYFALLGILSYLVFAKYHLQIDVASSGREGAEKTKQKHYDMILLDQMMPDMDGAKTMLEIKGQDNFDGEKTAIIAFTANTIGNMKEHYMQR